MNADRLFLETVRELASRAVHPTEYDVVMTAALLRKLLLDDPSTLVDVVNRERRFKITYVFNAREPAWKLFGDTPSAYAVEDGFDPRTAVTTPAPVEGSRDRLLSRMVLVHRGREVTVRNLIRYTANVAGGVHLGSPREEGDAAAQAAAGAMYVGGYPAGSRTLLAVGRVVARGLEPLVERVELDHSEQSA